ncbi:MAG: TonB-dependent receptor [Bacteroidota bacterium]
MRKLFLSILLLGFWTPGISQSQVFLDTVKVQSIRIPLRINETGRNITILRADQIQQLPFTSLDELLQYMPGVEVQSRNAFGAQGDISMRGATFSQVMVLVDGLKLNDPLTAHFNSSIPVAPSEISRIEILRGAAAAMYGADAVGGVIHIITKAYVRGSDNETDVSGNLNYGTHKLIQAQQGFSMQKDRLYIGGGFMMNQSDGELIPEKVLDNSTLEAYNNYFDIKTVGASFGYQFDKGWAVRGRMAYDYRDFSARHFYTNSLFDKSVETTRTWWNQLQVEKIGPSSRTDVNLGYKFNTDVFVFSPDFPSTNMHETQFLNLQLNHQQTINEKVSVSFGIQADQRSIESNDRGDHEDWHAGVYAMGVVNPIDPLHISGSLRLDYDQNYQTEVSPQINLSYVLPKVVFRASAGRSIRAADYTERYVSRQIEGLSPGRSLGNPDLRAENSWSEELGLDLSLTSSWTLKATGFLRQSSNLIDYVSTPASQIADNGNLQEGADYFLASNISNVQTRGLEIESWLRQSIGSNSSVNWSIGYTYLNTTNEAGIVSVYISSHAGHLLTTQAVINTPRLQLGINGLYKIRDERTAASINSTLAPGYTLWNTKLGLKLNGNLGINLQIHNLFDTAYQDILGAPMPGRWFMGGIQFGF